MPIFTKRKSKITLLTGRVWELEKVMLNLGARIDTFQMILPRIKEALEHLAKIDYTNIISKQFDHGARIEHLESLTLKDKAPSSDLETRLCNLEIWRASLNAMITDTTPRGKVKLNTIGRRFFKR